MIRALCYPHACRATEAKQESLNGNLIRKRLAAPIRHRCIDSGEECKFMLRSKVYINDRKPAGAWHGPTITGLGGGLYPAFPAGTGGDSLS